MINTVSWSGNRSYNVNHYVVDTEGDISELPTNCAMGSTATVISSGAKYIFNSKKQWVKQPVETAGGSGGTTSGDDIVILGTTTPSSSDNEITIL